MYLNTRPEISKLKSLKSIHDMFLTYLKFEIKPVYINAHKCYEKSQQIKTHLHNVDQTCYLGYFVPCENSSTFYINCNTINDLETFEIENKWGR